MRKAILSLIISCLLFSFIPFISNNSIKAELVDSDTIEVWVNSYINGYIKIIEEKFGQEYGYYFSFYQKQPFEIKSVISSKNGVAIEMVPNADISKMTFKNKYTDKKIEEAVFKDNILNNTILNASLFYKNKNSEDVEPLFIFNHNHYIAMSGIHIITNNWSFISFNESDLLLIKMEIDGVFYYHTYLNSNNSISFWTTENANNRSLGDIKNDLESSFLNALESNEFKEYFAYAPLETKISNIKYKIEEKRRNASFHYTLFDFENDIKDVYTTAYENYGITEDFLRDIIHFLDADYIFPSDNTTAKNNNETIIINFIVSIIFLSILIYLHKHKKEEHFLNTLYWLLGSIYLLIIGFYFFDILGKPDFIQLLIPLLAFVIVYISLKFFKYIKIKYKEFKENKEKIKSIKKAIDVIKNGDEPYEFTDMKYFLDNYNSKKLKRIDDNDKKLLLAHLHKGFKKIGKSVKKKLKDDKENEIERYKDLFRELDNET